MVRTEISLFLKNEPGELGKLAQLMADSNINIDALTIQDASAYVMELFKARGKSLKRIASAASYNSMRKDSAQFALIRLLAEDGKTNAAIDLLSQHDYTFDIMPVIAVQLDNKPVNWHVSLQSSAKKALTSTMFTARSPARMQNACLFFAPKILNWLHLFLIGKIVHNIVVFRFFWEGKKRLFGISTDMVYQQMYNI